MSSVRVVGYAINGRGMGHLTRQLAILRQVRRIAAVAGVEAECWVLTSSEADTLARREGIPSLKMPSKAMIRDAGMEPSRYLSVARTWVLNTLAALQPDVLVVDTFPAGSFGELVASLELARKRVLVARRVKEDFAAQPAYQALLPLYDATIVPDDRGTGPILLRSREELPTRQEARRALGLSGDERAVWVSLGGGGEVTAPEALPRLVRALRGRGWHVVVGAGPLYQGPEVRGPGITWITRYAPVELFPGLDAAVSAAGYNSFHELMHAGVPTVFVPLSRIADDQLERARRAQEAGAGRVATSVEEVVELLESPGTAAAAQAFVPTNGAVEAAITVLSQVLPAEDVRTAARALSPELVRLVRALRGRDASGRPWQIARELFRLLGGTPPSEAARRRALLAELADQGVNLPPPSTGDPLARVSRFATLVREVGVPLDLALALLQGLHRKFPAARGDLLLDGVETLFRAWAPFGDWMGAVSLLRALPTQRTWPLADYARDMAAWLDKEEDLFDALRDFSRLEGRGQRSAVEVMQELAR